MAKAGPIQTRSATRRRNGALGNQLMALTDDMMIKVLSCFDARALWSFMLTCRHFYALASSGPLWRALLQQEVGEANLPLSPVPSSSTWRRRFWQWQRLESCTLEACEPRTGGEDEAAPTARFLHRAACLSGRWLYIFGGRGEESEFSDLWVLDKELAQPSVSNAADGQALAHAWHRVDVDPAPPQRQSATLSAISTKLVMFGGRQGDTIFLNDTWIFCTEANAWSCVCETDSLLAPPDPHAAPRPSPRWAHSAVTFGQRVLVFGGSAPGKCYADLHWFDLASRSWRREVTEGPCPPARSGHCACAVGDGTMFVFGGNTVKSSFNDLWEYSVSDVAWRQVRASGRAPHGRVGHTITALGSRLLVLGGREYATNHFDTELHSFNVRSRHWAQVPMRAADPASGTVRTGHCATAHAGRLIVFGGLNDQNCLLDDITSVSFVS